MKKITTFIVLFLASLAVWAQGPNGTGTYYQSAHGKKGAELKTAMFEIIKNPSVIDYDSLWTAYNTSDARTMEGVDYPFIWDMYSGISRYPLYTYPHGTGAGNTEGVKGIQREHSMPKKWFNPTDASASGTKSYGDVRPMYSDLTHLIPTDAVCNNNRSDLCYGEITAEYVDWWSAENFCAKSKVNGCSTPGWAEQAENPAKTRVFEPNDAYKGDLARIYFYMATCYEPGYFSWIPVRDADKKKTGEQGLLTENHCGTWKSDMFNRGDDDAYQPFAPWALDMLMRWAKNDPVSDKERARNEAIWQFQGNRNPFVDYPGLEEYIWGDKKGEAFSYAEGGEAVVEPKSNNCELALNKTTLGVDWSANENLCNYWERKPITFEKDGITFTFSYGMEGKNLYADETGIRLYNYNTLMMKAHNNEITKVEFTVTDKNHDNKFLVASVGDMTDNVWTGSAKEVIFASNYVSSTKSGGVSKHYYIGVSNANITVADPTGIEQITQPERVIDTHTYNIMGICVDGQTLKPGIYIINGKKKVVK